MEKERAEPQPVNPVVYDGIRYEVLPWGKARELGQNGGYIAAVDELSGKELWILKVYDVKYDGKMEDDKQDVFITHLALSGQGSLLEVTTERQETYIVGLADRSVRKK